MSARRSGGIAALIGVALLLLLVPLVIAKHADSHDHVKLHVKRQAPIDSDWWYAQIQHKGRPAYGNNDTYQPWRNVKDYGAKGDGVTDDTDAINNATWDGNRCGFFNDCNQQTTAPGIIYFPPGTYIVSRPLIMLYYTQFIGDAVDLPVIKGTPDFFGIALLDSDPYLAYGFNWYQNQNNFWRHVRNFVIDMTAMPTRGQQNGIHWQVSQGTTIMDVIFNMVEGDPENEQQGMFMDNGSGGWGENLVFNGGGVGLFTGNQQWAWRNLTFNRCNTAIYQNWNWVYLYKSITINDCNVGLDMTQGSNVITTSSVILQDSVMNRVRTAGVLTTFVGNSTPVAGGTFVMDNVNFVDTPVGMAYRNGSIIVEGNQQVQLFVQGRAYTVFDGETPIDNQSCWQPKVNSARVQTRADPPPKPLSLLADDGSGKIFERERDQYINVPLSSFVSILDYGCINDGLTDQTQCVQDFFNSIREDQIAFIDHGAYIITNTVEIPIRIKMVGEAWSYFMIENRLGIFSDELNPVPAFRVGQPGQEGAVEMQEIIFQTRGPVPGAILMEWNLANEGGRKGANCMWDVHWRIGGTNGTQLQTPLCTKTPSRATEVNPQCIAAFLLLHLTSTAQVLMANNWGWVSDHELDLYDHEQINLYNGRGILVESQGPVWLYGTSFEHHVLYNYQISNAKEIYLGVIQTETAYMQSNPNSLTPFTRQERWYDPDFGNCFKSTCYKTWGLRITDSSYIYLYGGGMYSFFDNYDTGCLLTTNCQQNMVSLERSQAVYMYAVNTVGTENMVLVDGASLSPAGPNENAFSDTMAVFEYP
ncbi:Glucan 1,3-beta-glucosidase-like protein 6 [Elsinoe fawcettii]|nr:Glucan 1,3-beta-glucosidase-like protein 6 [Elsinoe fawcettii]